MNVGRVIIHISRYIMFIYVTCDMLLISCCHVVCVCVCLCVRVCLPDDLRGWLRRRIAGMCGCWLGAVRHARWHHTLIQPVILEQKENQSTPPELLRAAAGLGMPSRRSDPHLGISVAKLGQISRPIWQPWLQLAAPSVSISGGKSGPIWQHCLEY